MMEIEEYKSLYLCQPSPPSKRVIGMVRVMLRYYVRTENMNNRAALFAWKEVSNYIRFSGATNAEAKEARRMALQMHDKRDYQLL